MVSDEGEAPYEADGEATEASASSDFELNGAADPSDDGGPSETAEATTPIQADKPEPTAEDVAEETADLPPPPPPPSAEQILIRTLREKLEQKDAQLKEYITAYKQATADMDRERGRLKRDRERALDRDKMEVLGSLLDVLDNLGRSFDAAGKGGEEDDLLQGLDMVLQQFRSALSAWGVEPIDALGQPFDPQLHEATAMIPATGKQEDQEVLFEERKGYRYKGQLLRPSRVIVATKG